MGTSYRNVETNAVENILSHWEDNMYLFGHGQHFFQGDEMFKSPGVLNWKEFRKFLRDCRADTIFDDQRFGDSRGRYYVAASIMRWVATSKRIFQLSPEMQDRFQQINLGNIRFSDLTLPFPNFSVRFAKPLVDTDDQSISHSFALVTDFFNVA